MTGRAFDLRLIIRGPFSKLKAEKCELLVPNLNEKSFFGTLKAF
jgi:hypothetical protein